MEQFKKDLITTGRPSFIPALILGIIAIISAVTGIAFEFSRYDNFDPTHKGLAQLNAIYLMGPFAEETNCKILYCRGHQWIFMCDKH